VGERVLLVGPVEPKRHYRAEGFDKDMFAHASAIDAGAKETKPRLARFIQP
jgi:hypothetical protein